MPLPAEMDAWDKELSLLGSGVHECTPSRAAPGLGRAARTLKIGLCVSCTATLLGSGEILPPGEYQRFVRLGGTK